MLSSGCELRLIQCHLMAPLGRGPLRLKAQSPESRLSCLKSSIGLEFNWKGEDASAITEAVCSLRMFIAVPFYDMF